MEFIKPEEVIKNFELKPGMVAVDFGCGAGVYSIAMAGIVGSRGKVYAIDVQKDLLQKVKTKAEDEGLENVEIVWGNLDEKEGTRLANGMADLVLISNILFQADHKQEIIAEAFRILKPKGKVAAIEWQKTNDKIGPLMEQRISKQDLERMFLQGGFKFEKDFPAGESHYGVIFIK